MPRGAPLRAGGARGDRCAAQRQRVPGRATALDALNAAGILFLVAGAYACSVYAGIYRDTKDLDVMLMERDVPAALRADKKCNRFFGG